MRYLGVIFLVLFAGCTSQKGPSIRHLENGVKEYKAPAGYKRFVSVKVKDGKCLPKAYIDKSGDSRHYDSTEELTLDENCNVTHLSCFRCRYTAGMIDDRKQRLSKYIRRFVAYMQKREKQ